jgi:bla regulator protein BlaR1
MISTFLGGLEAVFGWLLEASWQASVLAILVLCLQWLFGEKLNPRWHHALWLLVVARLLLPALPESTLSLFQFAPKAPLAIARTVTEPIFAAPSEPLSEMPLISAVPARYPLSAFTVLALIWLAGTLGLLLLTWQVNRRFARHVSAARRVNDPRLLKLAAAAQEELGIHRSQRMIESEQVQSPAIMGLFRPTLILPAEVGTRFSDDELRFIFLHEFAHLKRGDLFLQWVIALLQILHWFNPVLWYAFRRARIDREPATDALVLSCTGETQKESYGQVLVKLLEHHRARYALPTLVGILEDKDQFKRRFSLIARFTRDGYGWSLLGMVILGVLAIAGLTKKLPAATTDDDPLIDISSSILEFKIDPKETKQVEEFQEVQRSSTEKDLNEALQKTHGFLLLGTGHDIQFHLSALTPPKDPNAHKIFRSSTQLHLGEDTVDSKINLHWIDAEHVQINCHLELRDAKNVSLGPLSATWIQPIGKDGVILLAKNGLTILAPQSDGSQIGGILRFVARENLKIGVSILAASDQMKDVELLPSGSDAAFINRLIPSTVSASDTLAQLVLALHDSAQSISSDHQRLQILKGFYGADGSWRDVTGILQKSVQNNSLKVAWQQPYTEIGGDPAFLHVKTLVVSYRLDGVEKLATFREENPPVGLQAAIPPTPVSTSNAPADPVPPTGNALPHPQDASPKDTAAIVNGTPVYWWQINYARLVTPSVAPEKAIALQEEIDNELMVQAADASDLTLADDSVRNQLDFDIKGFGGNKAAFEENLEKNGQTLEQFTKMVRREEILSLFEIKHFYDPARAYADSQFPPPPPVSNAEIKKLDRAKLRQEASDVAKLREEAFQAKMNQLTNDWLKAARSKASIQAFGNSETVAQPPSRSARSIQPPP